MKAPSIVILTGNHLCTNPRVQKEAAALASAGYDVEVLGAWSDPALKAQDERLTASAAYRFTPVLDAAAAGALERLHGLSARLRGRLGRLAGRFTTTPQHWQLGPVLGALTRAARARSADLFIAHSEAALWAARELSQAGRKVAVDMEDWFSQDLLPQDRARRPIGLLRELERDVLRRSAYASCPSSAMAAALAEAYGVPPLEVIYNAFHWKDREALDGATKDKTSREEPSIHWVSQTIGPGRGLEDLLAALELLAPTAQVHLRGNAARGSEGWVAERVPPSWRDRVILHGLVPGQELLSRIAEHDIGFAGEMKYCRNKELTISNKLPHYLLGGLAVVASDTDGQREAAASAKDAVLLYPSGDARALAAALGGLLSSSDELRRRKAAALEAARDVFSWESQQARLLRAVSRATGAPLPCA